MTATNSKENFSELLSSLSDGSPMWKLALSQMPAEVLEKEDRSLLMRAYWKTPAYRFHDELMSCVEEQVWDRGIFPSVKLELCWRWFYDAFKQLLDASTPSSACSLH